MNLTQLKTEFLSLTKEEQISLIKKFRLQRYELATKPKTRPKARLTTEKKQTNINNQFAKLPKEQQEAILKELESKLKGQNGGTVK
jgi:fructose-1-phosphate kinase PfkB-like protein